MEVLQRGADRNSTLPRGLLATGILLIFGGEAFCLLGPLRYERLMHVICHAILYTGIVCACLGALLYWAGRRGELGADRPPPAGTRAPR